VIKLNVILCDILSNNIAAIGVLDIECRKKDDAQIQESISHAEQTYSDRLGFTIARVRGSGE